jgi:CheY-like chemotaxis protein
VAKILVADDNSNIQKMVGLALKDQGIDVIAVGNGEAAVRKISDIKPDLVLADVFMPVRNGYEVCRYVKEDSALAHIPVILLVGAFDPLDEQEAQRSGADGVLKKPFVPPDPLISMVKSALVRAGVPLGPPAVEEKAPPPPKRTTADILGGAVTSSKIAALSGEKEKLPEVTPEPVEEFPSPMPRLKIAAGSQPVAFGNLLETPETAESEIEDLSVTAKPMIDLRNESKWEESDEVEEEKEIEEESTQGGWRPGGLDEEVERAAKPSSGVSDWREEAFHGNSPATSFSSSHWSPSVEPPAYREAAEAPAVAVATEETKPAESPMPFTSDAWAAAMAAGVEEKLGEVKDAAPAVTEAEAVPAIHQGSGEQAREAAPAVQESAGVEGVSTAESAHVEQPAEPANWAAVPETTWELEAKKASLLAATWDAPATSSSPEETQEIPAYSAEPQVEDAEQAVAEPAETSHYSSEPIVSGEAVETAQVEAVVEQPEIRAEEAASARVIEAPVAEPDPKSWENAWEAPVKAEESVGQPPVVEETIVDKVVAEEAYASQAITEPAAVAPVEEVSVPEPVAAESAPATEQPNMDELVDRVLGKMNPEVLQRVTRDILKPMIEAIVRDELERKG